MTIQATCPKGHTLTLEEKLAGKKIRCPRCQSVFEVPDLDNGDEEAVSEKPLRRPRPRDDDDEDDEDDRPARKPVPKARARDDDYDDDDDEEEMDPETKKKLERRLKKKHLKLVDVGLLLHLIKLYMYVIGMLFGIAALIMFVIAAAQTSARVAELGAGKAEAVEPGGGLVVMGMTILLLLVLCLQIFIFNVGPLLGIVGSFLCCWVPGKSQSRGTIIISLSFDMVCLLCSVLGFLNRFNIFGFDDPLKIERLAFLLSGINSFCLISSWLVFLTFLRGLGKYLGEPGVGNEALNLIARLVVQVISLIGNVIINVASAFMLGGINPFLGIGVGIVCIVIWTIFFIFGFFIRLIKLIGAMRRAVQNKL